MDLEKLREYCLKKKGVTESFPFGEDTLVYKVMNKIFAITGFSKPVRVNLKCDTERAVELRERYEDIIPGYHMNKQHWNTVMTEAGVPDKMLRELIDHSYELIVKSLPKKTQEELEKM